MPLRFTRIAFVLALLLSGCASPSPPPDLHDLPEGNASSPLAATFEAHGGLQRWQSQRTLSYQLDGFPLSPQVAKPNRSTVDLRARRNRIEGEEFTVGFDGERAWSLPGPDAAGLPTRFFNLGSFYFVGMPFVFADPGARVEPDGMRSFRGRSFRTYRVTYPPSVGHSSDDYLLYIDPATDRLRLIRHSVTELGPDLRVVWLFDEWQDVDGLLMVRNLTYYPDWNDGDLSDGAVTVIRDLQFSTEPPDPGLYTPPYGSAVAGL